MKQTCRNCGEELLGDVNRCWKCGTLVFAPITATLAATQPEPATTPGTPGESAAPAKPLPPAIPQRTAVPKSTPSPWSPLAGASAVLALLAGTASVYVAFYSHWGLGLASLGILLAAWGTFSRLRGFALLALVFCVLGVGIACYNLAVDVYAARYGIHPLAPNTPVE